jgi:hypothetical protein
MGRFVRGDVVVVPFPFSDLTMIDTVIDTLLTILKCP